MTLDVMWICSLVCDSPPTPAELGSFIFEGRLTRSLRDLDKKFYRVAMRIKSGRLT